jgi:hypothetical protein
MNQRSLKKPQISGLSTPIREGRRADSNRLPLLITSELFLLNGSLLSLYLTAVVTNMSVDMSCDVTNVLHLEILDPLSTAGTPPLFSYISRTRGPPCSELAPCLEQLQSTTSPYPSSQSPLGILSHTSSQDPTNPTIATVSGISKVFVVVGF